LKQEGRITFVTFHPSYTYEDFVEGIKPRSTTAGEIAYDVVDGVFKQFCKKAQADPNEPYVFLIDEINRGSISKVFGELIHCIEYRGNKTTLPLSKSWYPNEPDKFEFSIPNNLFLLGTMNTADKSIAFVDYALRRRFSFLELYPDIEAIRQYPYANDETRAKAINLFTQVNRFLGWTWDENLKLWKRVQGELEARPKDHLVGHTYFFASNLDQLKEKWEKQVIPLVKEYYFDIPDKLERIDSALRFDTT
jgi:5-methylcytosine-specific restriction protein B